MVQDSRFGGRLAAIALLALVCLATFVAGLGRSAIQDSDEAYYAEAGREMVASGDWITPHYNFEPRMQKPILSYWLIAASYRVLGTTETAARLPAALSGFGLALVACFVGMRWAGYGTGLVAGVIVATSFGVVPFARLSLPDVPLALFVSLAAWAGLEAIAPAARARRAWLSAAAAAAALGVLTKGPVAVVLPVLVILPVLAWHWRTGRAVWPLRAADVAIAAVVFIVIAVPWYVAEVHARGAGYLKDFFVGENVDRFTTTRYNTWRGWNYVPIVIGGLLPWSIYGLLWARPLLDRLRGRAAFSDVDIRLGAWSLAPLAFFMVSVGSQPRYILPCLVPLAILLGRTIWSRVSRPEPGIAFGLATVASGLCVVGLGALLLRAWPLVQAASAGAPRNVALAVVAAGAVAVLAGVFGRRGAPGAVAVAAGLSVLTFDGTVLVQGRPEPVEIIARAVRDHGPARLVCACGAFARSLTFYTGVPTDIENVGDVEGEEAVRRFLDTPDRVMAVVNADMLATVEAHAGRAFPRLAAATYLNTSVWPAALLDPDVHAVQHVVLIANR
jgi:4-amino-4-deoxy-L-arabinose transferase-like glycosyltransferase